MLLLAIGLYAMRGMSTSRMIKLGVSLVIIHSYPQSWQQLPEWWHTRMNRRKVFIYNFSQGQYISSDGDIESDADFIWALRFNAQQHDGSVDNERATARVYAGRSLPRFASCVRMLKGREQVAPCQFLFCE